MTMKKLLIFLFTSAFLLVGSNAFAFSFNQIDTYLDLNAVAQADADATNDNYFTADGGDGVTGTFSELTYLAYTLSDINLDTGDTTDRGMLIVTGLELNPPVFPGDTEDHDSSWTMTITWDDLQGEVDSIDPDGTLHSTYTSGTFNVYIDYDEPGHTFDVDMTDINDFSTLEDGLQVATIDITGGSNTVAPSGEDGSSYELYGEFTDILDDFWFNAATGEALEDISGFDLGWVIAYTHGDTNPENITRWTEIINGEEHLMILSDHDSSITVGVVPEPSTFVLFGFSLLGAAGFIRRKS